MRFALFTLGAAIIQFIVLIGCLLLAESTFSDIQGLLAPLTIIALSLIFATGISYWIIRRFISERSRLFAASIVLSPMLMLLLPAVFVLSFSGGVEYLSSAGRPYEQPLPELPWPMPAASAVATLTPPLTGATFGDLDSRLTAALDAKGYEYRYFAVLYGFAIVSRIERIDTDGRSMLPPSRWDLNVISWRFRPAALLRGMFQAPEGLWRVFVFAITNSPFAEGASSMSRQKALEWLESGFNQLPANVAAQLTTDETRCTVLVYEFAGKGYSNDVETLVPGHFTVAEHMKASGLANEIRTGNQP